MNLVATIWKNAVTLTNVHMSCTLCHCSIMYDNANNHYMEPGPQLMLNGNSQTPKRINHLIFMASTALYFD